MGLVLSKCHELWCFGMKVPGMAIELERQRARYPVRHFSNKCAEVKEHARIKAPGIPIEEFLRPFSRGRTVCLRYSATGRRAFKGAKLECPAGRIGHDGNMKNITQNRGIFFVVNTAAMRTRI